MRNELVYYIVDVFAEKKYTGNQLAVFRNTRGLSSNEMQLIAKEINFSETTFINSDNMRDDGFDVTIFTPEAEVPFAGHPTLGTAFIIKEYILKKNIEHINLNLKIGKTPVKLSYNEGQLEYLWMKQINPIFGENLSPDEVVSILNIEMDDIDLDYPIQKVSTGLPYFIVPVKTLKGIQKININLSRYYDFIKRYNLSKENHNTQNIAPSAFFAFCTETYDKENNINARMFDDFYGVPEDPATGSASGCLLAYLLKHNYFNKNEIELRIEQGYEIKRPSLIKAEGKFVSGNKIEIFIGGKVHAVAEGKWF